MRQPCTPGGALEAGRPTPTKERGRPGGEGGRGQMSSGAVGEQEAARLGLQEVAGEERPEEASGKEGGPTRGPI